jgi:hypothetical protein
MSFCAICCDEKGPFVRRPLGKDDALVFVCTDCDSETPREKFGPELAYEAPELGQAFRREVNTKERKIRPKAPARWTKPMEVRVADREPNTILVRVAVDADDGKKRDMRDACTTFAHEPWSREVRYLGFSRGEHLFERPNPLFASKQRRADINVIAALEALARSA